MKKLLILALLFVGCGIFEEEGNPEVCVYQYNQANDYKCWNDVSEVMCVGKNDDISDSYRLEYHGDDYTDCDSYCSGMHAGTIERDCISIDW